MRTYRHLLGLLVVFVVSSHAGLARGQGYGSDLQNVMAPASGGMAGVSTALPQDVPSAVFGNPATLAQFEGTQFTMGGGWVEGYPTVVHTPDGIIGTPFSATSRTEGAAATEIGVTQDLRSLGVAGTLGLGLAGISGGGAEYRGEAPGTLLNNESGEYLVLGINLGAGYQLTDRLSVGATMTLGTGFEQLGFVGPLTSSAMVNAYALRGSVGVDYKLTDCTTLGFYYQSKMSFTFEDAVSVLGSPTYRNINITQPTTFGWGVANRSLMNGDLLIAADVYYKLWEDAALWQDIMVNEWAVAVGAQLTRDNMKYRLGYSYNSNPINHSVGSSLDGIGTIAAAVQLYQASSAPFVNQNRITGGIGRQDFLFPGLDVDLFGGGLLPASDSFGSHNTASLAMYYVGLGLTWRYDACKPASDGQ
jgi:long-chain fatty acid transport protein